MLPGFLGIREASWEIERLVHARFDATAVYHSAKEGPAGFFAWPGDVRGM